MKKILVVFTGGTIGSVAVNGAIDTSDSARFNLLQLFNQCDKSTEKVEFDTLEPLQILSENLAPAAWKTLINAIDSVNLTAYDGIIVTHGTDTLAYTAAALGFYYHKWTKPILLVSSDYPLANPKANGLVNFRCAVEFIRRNIATGVFVPYRNNGQVMLVHRGTRLASSLQLSGDFYSVQNKSCWRFDDEIFKPVDGAEPIHSTISSVLPLKPEYSNRILMIKPYPGLDYTQFDLNHVDAVLHDLYHSGTACTSSQWGDQHSLVKFLQYCGSANIPVYMAPALKSENAYQSTRELIKQGAEMIWNMSIEAAYVKLMLAYGNFTDQHNIAAFIEHNLAGEKVASS